jgi:hypothetical protein
VRRLVAWLLGGFALFGFLKRRAPAAEHDAVDVPELDADARDPRAEELRRKLAESRSMLEERDEFEAAEPTVDQTEHAPDDPERRRREVHEAGRTIAREMRRR